MYALIKKPWKIWIGEINISDEFSSENSVDFAEIDSVKSIPKTLNTSFFLFLFKYLKY